MRSWIIGAAVAAILTAGCEVAEPTPAGNGVCHPPERAATLPTALDETSGVAASRAHPGIFWTHNDSGGDPVVFAVDSTGRVLARIRLRDATNRDWEDIAIGPCQPGGEDCLWVAEIGDNSERHPHVAVYRIAEPDPAADTAADAEIIRFAYPDGPRDAESLFVTDRGIHIVNKGRSDAIELFRLAPPYRPGAAAVVLDRVQRLAPPPTSVSAQVTAAAVDPSGSRALLRTYSGLRFFQVEGDSLRPWGRPADVVAPAQLQGEGADFLDGDRIVVTSEARSPRPPSLAIVSCDPTRPPPDTTGTTPAP